MQNGHTSNNVAISLTDDI